MEAPAPPPGTGTEPARSLPPAWPRPAQAVTAGLLAVALALLSWHTWTLQRGSTRPTMLVAGSGLSQPDLQQEPSSPPALLQDGTKRPPADLLDINEASAAQLQQLPRVGPQMAQRIVAARSERPFHSVDDLRRVRGIGPKTLETLRPFVRVAPTTSAQLADRRPARP